MTTHEVKIWPRYFDDVASGRMTHNLRKNDRGYRNGDRIVMREWRPADGQYTGRECVADITHVLQRGLAPSERSPTSLGLSPGYAILSLKLLATTANSVS